MEPYRTPGLQCPHCPGVSLREFQRRYCCDACEGILIPFDDLTSAVADLRDEQTTLEYFDETPTLTPCPLCERTLVECHVKLVFPSKTIKVRETFLRCSHDGLWCGSGVLATMFAKVPLIGGSPSYKAAPQAGMDGIPHRSGSATTGLRISQWRERRRHRAKTLTPINAYADRDLVCPTCTAKLMFQGDRWTCLTCTGAFIQDAALASLVVEMTSELWEMPAIAGKPGPRACPVCRESMLVEQFGGVDIDRCSHGVWFDASELATALEHAAPAHGVAAWLKRVFFQG